MGLLYFRGAVYVLEFLRILHSRCLLSFRDKYFGCLQATYAEYSSSVGVPSLLRYENHANSYLQDPQQNAFCTFAQ